MFVFSFFLALLYLLKSNGEALDEEQDVFHTLFGNIASMEDLFLKEPEDGKTPAPTSKPKTTPAPDDDFDSLDLEFPDTLKLNRANISNHSFDLLDFLVINKKYSNISKEYKKNIKKMPNNTRRNEPDDTLGIKRTKLKMVMVQFTMHCRYEVGKALKRRDSVRDDKRYKLGYLFNRMRRLKTEEFKLVALAYDEARFINNVRTLMKLYERIVQFDVDMRDTAAIIRSIYNVDAPYDKN